MSVRTYLRDNWGQGDDSPELVQAQHQALMRQVPVMYAVMVVNVATPAILFHSRAPFFLSVTAPLLFISFFIFRATSLYRRRHLTPTPVEIRGEFKTITFVAVVMSMCLTAWAIALFQYADDMLKGQITSFVGITMLTAITCLMPLRQVALILFLMVSLPTSVYLLLQFEPVFHAVALNLVAISIAMLMMLRRSHEDFRERVAKEVALGRQRQEMQHLHHAVLRAANEDNLTGLPNRLHFIEVVTERLEKAKETRRHFAVGVVDLDGFKPINDLMGYHVGDTLLAEVARRLRAAAPDHITIARIGGDEFGIIFPDADDEDRLRHECRAILSTLEPEFQLSQGTVALTGTCGIARCTGPDCHTAELFEHAGFALRYGKAAEPGSITIFSDFHERAIKDAATIAKRLRESDLAAVLQLEYQPIIDSRSGKTLGMEALARWTDPELGRVPPDVFIRTAEQHGMIGKVTVTLLGKALQEVAKWPEDNYLSFNLSAQDICSHETMTAIFATIGRSNISPRRLVFEITESSVMQNFDRALQSLETLKAAGCHLALDDFGTGYSSLSYVRRLPIDRVKVDGSFLKGIEQDIVSLNLVKTISEMCVNLNLQCILEGVETERQAELLNDIGCTAYQGYLFARPMCPNTLAAWRHEHDERISASG
jgi:diguanylate cyclase (GGDEF)-like protein